MRASALNRGAAAGAAPCALPLLRCRALRGASRRAAGVAVRAAGGEDGAGAGAKRRTRELPIFPLGVVALPHATVPLMIFEPR